MIPCMKEAEKFSRAAKPYALRRFLMPCRARILLSRNLDLFTSNRYNI